MDLSDEDAGFLRDVVKSARQRTHLVSWTDRDGTERHSALTAAETARLKLLAHRHKLSLAETLRQAAHIPVPR